MKKCHLIKILLTAIISTYCAGSLAAPLNAIITRDGFSKSENDLIIESNDNFLDEYILNNLYKYDYSFNDREFFSIDIVKAFMAPKNPKRKAKKPIEEKISPIYNVQLSQNKEIIEAHKKISKKSFEAIITAKSLIQQGYYGKAAQILNKEANETNNPWVNAEIASYFEKMKKFSKAINLYEKSLAKTPERIELLYSYALCLYKNNDINKAEQNLSKITAINPNFMLAYYNLGNIQFKKGNYKKALGFFNKSIKLNPYCADAFYNTALILETLDYKHLAYKYYQKSLELKPDDIYSIKAIQRLAILK